MNRRETGLVWLSLAAAGWPALAQRPVRRIGYFGLANAKSDAAFLDAFRAGLRELRWVEGQDYVIDARFADGSTQAAPALAEALVASAPDLLLTPAEGAGRLLFQRTKTIPIVFGFAVDPVGSGFAASLRKPGGNVTGLSSMASELWPKRVQLFNEAFPAAKHLGMVFSPAIEISVSQAKAIGLAAASLSLRVTPMELKESPDIAPAFPRAASQGVQAYVVAFDAITQGQRREIADHLTRLKAPAMFATAQYVEAGGLMSYSASITDNFRRAAEYADKILKGVPPGDLSIEQPTRFELVLNLQTAKAIGATIPKSFLVRVDRLVE